MSQVTRRPLIISLIIVGALLVAAALAALARARNRAGIQETILPPVAVMKPVTATIARTLSLPSQVEAERMVTVVPKASGMLTSLTIEVGDKVLKGQVIATIDREPYRIALDQATAAFTAAQSAYERTQTLAQRGSASRQDLERVKSHYEGADAQLRSARLNYQNTRIESPVNGAVIRRFKAVGEIVSQATPIATLGNIAELMVTAQVPEQYVSVFVDRRDSLTVTATAPALGERLLTARVESMSPYIQPETRTFEVTCRIEGETRYLLPGLYLDLIFALESRPNVPALPHHAIVGGKTLWYVDSQDSTAHSMSFSPAFENDSLVQVPDTLRGYLFIVRGQHFIREGVKVRIVNDPSRPEARP